MKGRRKVTYQDILKVITGIITSIGGVSLVIIGLSSWLGKIWANRILEKDRLNYNEKLEKIKSEYLTDLEEKKGEIDKAKTLFSRYSEHQFSLYTELYRSLYDLKIAADKLWEIADYNKLRDFSKQLNNTITTVEKSILLIEDDHYSQLTELLDAFANYKIGKTDLIKFRNLNAHNQPVNTQEILTVIENNRITKEAYTLFIQEIGRLFKRQIKLGG
ncbi:hypothetical protein [Paenibacillus antarcticus]|uniref:hypothetical protein n=1 Tax=Paenibacillus antarcticus TaxID=253703 RepID=UPI0012EEBB58|nr:hypothetical protein [Paenibacillus antarcticus]